MRKHVPNLLTCLNLLSGCLGILFAFQGQFTAVAFCVLASGLFDLFDGMSARLLGVSSPLGVQLDSLADMISFGFLPGMIYYQLLINTGVDDYFSFAAFIITAFSALRLAKFNIDERQHTDFIGLNTPMNTFYVISLPFVAERFPELVLQPLFLLGSVAITSWLLISEIRLFSMKTTSLGWKANRFKYLFLVLGVVLLISLQWLAVPLILLLYFLFSVLHFRIAN